MCVPNVASTHVSPRLTAQRVAVRLHTMQAQGATYGQTIYGTTILSVRKNGKVAVVGDGQVTQGSQVLKPNATKVSVPVLRVDMFPHVIAARPHTPRWLW